MTTQQERMTTPIYDLLLFSNPQALQNLADYQKRKYGESISIPIEKAEAPVNYRIALLDIVEIDREMRKAPKHWVD